MASPPYESYQPFCNDNAVSIAKPHAAHKKPRHRHSPKQLAALNELFEQNEHPSLEQRTALAESLGMETKTVNAWFQNKRASSKKKVKGGGTALHDSHNKSLSSLPSSQPAQQQQQPTPVKDCHRPEIKTLCDDTRESENLVRESRNRPHEEQLEELRKVYSINSHPTPEARQALSTSLGMTYEKVTNWFQNQRYLTKKKSLKEDEDESQLETREVQLSSGLSPPYPRFPPPTSHPSIRSYSALRRSSSVSPSTEDRFPRRSRMGAMPYRCAASVSARTRRSRPEPYQLEALKKLFKKTSTPTIEERTSLALEIGMDIGKVTNWFRNLRQSSRKHCKKLGYGDDDDDDDAFQARDPYSASSSVSRSGSPLPASPVLYIKDEDSMDLGGLDDHCHTFSVDNSEDEYQEAVTPPPEPSLSPPPEAITQPASNDENFEMLLSRLPFPIEIDKASVERFPGIKVEDALLLLTFHHHIVQY